MMNSKRLFDLVVVMVSLPILMPVYVLCVLVLFIFQGLPVHYYQSRSGKSGVEFKLIKFRSMVNNAAELGSIQTKQNDARITRIGKYFRLFSLDEIPQLINVLRGDMSLVGPRPFLLAQKKDFDNAQWNKRLQVKPGITGLAQVAGRSNCPVEKRIKLDIEYVRTRSLLLDFKILLNTISIVILGKGSN